MRYMGSKRRIADEILPIILNGRKAKQYYVEPLCGGCNTLERVPGLRIAGDVHSELIAMYIALQNGWLPPKLIREEEYIRLRDNPKADPALRGYAGFTHSFGSIYFGTYRRHPNQRIGKGGSLITGARLKSNYANMNYVGNLAYNQILSLATRLRGVKFFNCPYYDLPIPRRSIIYCDPPYAGTSGYSSGSFPHSNFWQWCRVMKDEGHKIFISEYNAPGDFKCVWKKEIKLLLNRVGRENNKNPTEKLFTL